MWTFLRVLLPHPITKKRFEFLDANEIIIGENSDYEIEDECFTISSTPSNENPNDSSQINETDEKSDSEEEQESSLGGATATEFSWSKNSLFIPNAPIFVSPDQKINDPALKTILDNEPTPLSVFKYFVNEATVQNIIAESEKFSEDIQRADPNTLKNFASFSKDEYWTFMGLHFLMGVKKMPALKNYWSQDELLLCPIFGSKMSRSRYLDILRTLHFSDNKFPNRDDRFWKLGSFLPDILGKFQNAINAGEFLCIDESLVGFKGRLAFRQYIPNKRCRFDVKFFVLVDQETNFILAMIPYQGKQTKFEGNKEKLGVGGAAVYTLLQNHLFKNHRVVTDSWFISPNLAQSLHDNGTLLLGTARKSRKNMPKISGKIKKMQSKFTLRKKLWLKG